jgi:hypothetical protein
MDQSSWSNGAQRGEAGQSAAWRCDVTLILPLAFPSLAQPHVIGGSRSKSFQWKC